MSCVKTADVKISLPILAINYLSPLLSIMENIGIPVGFLTWVYGEPQSGKTSLVSGINSHFGNFNRYNSPLNFLDRIPSFINKCSKLHDVPILCDDYFPSTNGQEASQMKTLTEKMISLCYDKMIGSRSKSNGQLRKNHKQRCLIIATGEMLPELSQSRISRLLQIPVKANDIYINALKEIQNHREELQYTMKKYIEYIISNSDEIEVIVKKIYEEKTVQANKELTYRTSEMIVSLYIGFFMLINFAVLNGVIKEEEKDNKLAEGWKVLVQVGKEQNEEIENASPISMVTSAIEALASTQKIYVVDIKSAPYMRKDDIYKPEFIGFYDSERNSYCIYQDLLYKKVRDFYRQQGIDFPFNKANIFKELMLKGFLYKTDKQARPQIRIINPINKHEESTIALLADKFYISCKYNENGTVKEK